ncbi:MAG: hypothetical protein ABR559_07270 [Gemmatimonadota bacterium]
MNIVRVIFGLILVGAGVAATLTQPGLVMWIALGVGAALLLLTVVIEARVRQGDPRQVATGALGLAAGFGFAALVTLVASTLPATAALLANHAAATGFGVVVVFLLLGYLGAAAGQAVTYELTLFRQPEQAGGAKAASWWARSLSSTGGSSSWRRVRS